MGLELPQALQPLLPLSGHTWPDIDEMGLAAEGVRLGGFGDDSRRTSDEADDLISWVHSRNDSEGVRAFHDDWRDETGLAAEGNDALAAIRLMAYAMIAASLIVFLYKLGIISALIRLMMRLLATAFLPGSGPAVFAAESIAATKLRGTIGDLFGRMVLRPLAKAGELLNTPMVRRPARWPVSFRSDPLRAAVRPVDLRRLEPQDVAWRTDRRPLWRGDDRSPDEIFESGFHQRGDRLDLKEHQTTYTNSGFVSTTRGVPWAYMSRYEYRYLVDAPGGIDMNRTMYQNGVRAKFRREREVDFPGGIRREYIVGAQKVRRRDGSYGGFVPNPHYNPGS
ncbi:scabin-related ADP-ribosyltransferase [Streptosporangium sp. NBC_01469]|uniref:scabin-related ADP-ribosyltransferase n=1 Tax=Streptosporangium sp. NBC_01469 TaxID=2903898 RepID=UPI002E2D3FBA|nr:hypothetical protein [Streptosporangium sp. NBC_01469]